MSFEAYYNSEWLPKHSYFEVHKVRFLQSWESVKPFLAAGQGSVLDTGGLGPLSSFICNEYGWAGHVTTQDLRMPLDIKDISFDLIICTETIEHIKDVDSAAISDLERFNYSGVNCMLREFARLLHPNGVLLVTTPNANSYISLSKWMAGEVVLMDPEHVREFSVRDLVRVAGAAGLEPRLVKTVDSWDHHFGDTIKTLRAALSPMLAGVDIERGDNIIALFGKRAADASAV